MGEIPLQTASPHKKISFKICDSSLADVRSVLAPEIGASFASDQILHRSSSLVRPTEFAFQALVFATLGGQGEQMQK